MVVSSCKLAKATQNSMIFQQKGTRPIKFCVCFWINCANDLSRPTVWSSMIHYWPMLINLDQAWSTIIAEMCFQFVNNKFQNKSLQHMNPSCPVYIRAAHPLINMWPRLALMCSSSQVTYKDLFLSWGCVVCFVLEHHLFISWKG